MDLNKDIQEYDLVFLDLETTGLDVVLGDAICEIGAFRVRKGEIIDKFHSLINPNRPVPQEAFRVHQISEEELKAAPRFEAVIDKLINFLQGGVLCAYNVDFDLGFIDHSLRRINSHPLDIPAIDILAMARDALTLPRYNLETVVKSLGIDCGASFHRALDDALRAYQAFFKLADIFKQKGINRLDDYLSLYGAENEIFRSKENTKIAALKEAVDQNQKVNIKYFSRGQILTEERILPLRIFREGKNFYLLYQGQTQASSQICLRRVLDVQGV